MTSQGTADKAVFYKNWVFAVSGPQIVGNFVYIYVLAPHLQPQGLACPTDSVNPCTQPS